MTFLRPTLILLFLIVSLKTNCQIISQFTWDSAPVTAADIGPDATSVSTSAISDAGGVGGTNGLNAGLPKQDINLVIPGSPTFDVNGIDVSFDYQREESVGTFLQRGSSLIIQGCSNLSVTYRVEDGGGGYTSVSSGNVFVIPDDDIYRNYRFYYLPATGEGVILVNDVVVWSNDGPDGRNLYWTGAGNLVVGSAMDGTGFNDTFMDNLIIAAVFDSPLPIQLVDFTAECSNITNEVSCSWQTASEVNNDFFTIERSHDAVVWESLGRLKGAGNSVALLNYSYVDSDPYNGVSYYRLKQTDFDGDFTYSEIKSIDCLRSGNLTFTLYPNPASGEVTIFSASMDTGEVKLFNALGQEIKLVAPIQDGNNLYLSLENLEKGIYFIQYQGANQQLVIR